MKKAGFVEIVERFLLVEKQPASPQHQEMVVLHMLK
jgi:hypothetical protein